MNWPEMLKSEPFDVETECPECGEQEVQVLHTYYVCKNCEWVRKCIDYDIKKLFNKIKRKIL